MLHRICRKAFVNERFEFYGKTLTGTPKLRDRWKRAIGVTNAAMGDAVESSTSHVTFRLRRKRAPKQWCTT